MVCHNGDRAKPVPGSTCPRLPLAELDCGGRSFADKALCWLPSGVGVARSRGRRGSGGARESRRFDGHAKTEGSFEDHVRFSFTGGAYDISNQDPRWTQKNMYSHMFTHNIRF